MPGLHAYFLKRLWSDEMRIIWLETLWRKSEAMNPRNIISHVKYGVGGNLVLWECCSGNGMDHLFKSSWTMEKKSTMIFERKIFYLFRRWHFPIQDYNDSEHTNALKNCLKDKISILTWHAMYLNLNPIENLWQKLRLHTRQH